MKTISGSKEFSSLEALPALILKRIEFSPNAIFAEADLRSISKPVLEVLKKQKILKYVQYDPEAEPYHGPGDDGAGRLVRRIDGKYVAFSAEGSPLTLEDRELDRWSFDLTPFLEQIRTANKLTRSINAISERVIFIGEQEVSKAKVGVFLGLFVDDEQVTSELLSLWAKTGKADQAMVLCPTYTVESQDLSNRLEGQRIACFPFKEIFKSRSHAIDFGMLGRVFDNTPTFSKSPEQIADTSKFQYKCEDQIHFPGLPPKNRSNQIEINATSVSIGDSLFSLLLQLIVAAKTNRRAGGWTGLNLEPGKYQPISNLRTAIQGSLRGKNGKDFIESDGSKAYRISVHPDFITYDKQRLLAHPVASVKDLARRLP